ncbi:MAG TPA: glycosyltransferase family 39 protein [Anaerolineales bacterium]|nr:glycosyltransferase family 39 protein [Anaerolineales bacterium]
MSPLPIVSNTLHARRLRWEYWLLLALVGLGFALRAYRLDANELRGDEAFSWNYTANKRDPLDILQTIVREADPQPPIHYWLLQPWVKTMGDSEWMLRFPSVLLSLLLLPLLWRFAKQVGGRSLAGWVLVLAVLHPQQIWLAQDVRNMYPLAVGSTLAGLICLPFLLAGKRWAFWGYIGCGIFAMFSHYYAVFGWVAQVAYLLAVRPSRQAWLRWLAAGAGIAASVLAWAVFILPALLRGQLSDPHQYAASAILFGMLAEIAASPAVQDPARLALVIGWLVLMALGTWQVRRSPWLMVLWLWAGLASAGIYVTTLRRGTFNNFYLMVAFPALYILLAGGWVWLYRQLRWGRLLAGVVGVAMLSAYLPGLFAHYHANGSGKNNGVRPAIAYAIAHQQTGSAFISNTPDPVQVYYLRQTPFVKRLLLPSAFPFESGTLQSEINSILQAYPSVWLLPFRNVAWDPNGQVESFLNTSAIRTQETRFAQTRIIEYQAPNATIDQLLQPQATLANGASLQYAYLTINGQPNTDYVGSDWVRVSLVWQAGADWQARKNWRVFVHAVAPDGFVVAQHDGEPQNGALPTQSWQSGLQVLDVHEFQIPAGVQAHTLKIWVGMYDPTHNERLLWQDGQDGWVLDWELRGRVNAP